MTDACLCYTTDKGYILPTILSAIQARSNLTREKGDVVILFVGKESDDVKQIAAPICELYDVKFQVVPPGDVENLSPNFARHFLDDILEPHYKRVIHVDGDTQISDSIDPLFDVAIPSGGFLAVRDPMALMILGPGKEWERRRSYFQSIGLDREYMPRYFNTGIFGAHRSDLAVIGPECRRICKQNGPRLHFNEQDAFNIAFGKNSSLISLKWNFPVFFLNFKYDEVIHPRIFHFMSNPRPWEAALLPWGLPAHRVYHDLIAKHPELAGFLRRISPIKLQKYRLQQHYKRAVEPRNWKTSQVLARIQENESEAVV